MADDATIQVSIRAVDNLSQGLGSIQQSLGNFQQQVSGGLSGIKQSADDAKSSVQSFAGDFVTKMAEMATAVLGVREAINLVKEGIGFSDQIRDIATSLTALERGVGDGAAAFEKFRAMADQTRNTTLELATAFRDALPAAMRRGISDETLSSITVQMAKIAPLLGQSLDSVMTQWDMIMSGRVRKNSMLANLLLGGSGYTIEDITSGTATNEVFQAMFANMDKLAAKGEEMGLTFETAGKKIKDTLLEAFESGFAGGQKGYQGLVDAFKDPALLNAIHDIGKAIADWLPTAAKVAAGIAQMLSDLPKNTLALLKKPDATGITGALQFLGGNPDEQGIFSPAGSTAAQVKAQNDLIARLRQIQDWQRTFGQYAQPGTGQLGPGQMGPAAPNLMEFISGAAGAESAASKLSADVTGSPDQINDLGKAADALKEKIDEIKAHYKGMVDAIRAEDLGAAFASKVSSLLDVAKAAGDPIQAYIDDMRSKGKALIDQMVKEQEQLLATLQENEALKQAGAPAKELLSQEQIDAMGATITKLGGQILTVKENLDSTIQSGVDKLKQHAADAATAIEDSLTKAVFNVNSQFQQFGMGGGGTNQFNPLFQAGMDQQQAFLAQYTKTMSDLEAAKQAGDQKSIDRLKVVAKELQTAMETGAKAILAAAKEWETSFVQPMTDMFTSLATSGGKGFGDTASKWFIDGVKGGSHVISELLGKAVLSAFGANPGPNASPEEVKQAQQRQQQIGGVITGTIGLAEGFANLGSHQGSAFQNILGTTLSGASLGTAVGTIVPGIGNVIGAVVGAIVGLIGGAIGTLLSSSLGSTYQYATDIGFNQSGKFTGTPNANIDKNTWAQMQQQAYAAYNEYFDGLYKILMKFPGEILPNVNKAIHAQYGYFEQGADFGNAASKQFAQEYSNYLAEGLPHQIFGVFSTYMEKGLENLGMTADKFKQVWGELSNMDPKTAMQTLSDLGDVMVAFSKDLADLSMGAMGTRNLNDLGSSAFGGMFDVVRQEMSQTFDASTKDLRDQITQSGELMTSLPDLQGQVNAGKDMTNLLDQYIQKWKDFLKTVAQSIDSINQSYQAQMSGYKLEGMVTAKGTPDYNAQLAYMQQQAEMIRQQMMGEVDPTKVASDYQQLASLIDKMKQLGVAGGGDTKAFLTWAEDQLKKIHDLAIQRENDLAAQTDKTNKDFLSAIKDFITAFETATTTLNNTTNNVVTPGGGTDPNNQNQYPKPQDISQPIVDASNANTDRVVSVLERIAGAVESGQSITVVTGSSDSSGFLSRTQSARSRVA